MAIDRFSLLRNTGQFDSVQPAQLNLAPLTLVYAENGRGKTTLATIMRSLSTGDAGLINERRRLGAAHPPHIVVHVRGVAAPHIFMNGAWNNSLPRVAIFDDVFVAQNVCSGIEIESTHRANLHELILGAQGVQLNTALQRQITAVEQHNRDLRERSNAIPVAIRGTLSVEDFCDIAPDDAIEDKIEETQRRVAAAQSAEAIQRQELFSAFALPSFNVEAINELLARDLEAMEALAVENVQAHTARLGQGGETWVSQGMALVAPASEGHDHEVCPFCDQNLVGSPLIQHYQAYFSDEYRTLKTAISEAVSGVNRDHSGDLLAAFERNIRVAAQSAEFWARFAVGVPAVDIDTAAVVRAWNAAKVAVLGALRAKQAAPLERAELPAEAQAAIEIYNTARDQVKALSNQLQAVNPALQIVKEQAAGANMAALNADLQRLARIRARFSEPAAGLCAAYLAEKVAKSTTEGLRNAARIALDEYRERVFPAYEVAINTYLGRFNAGFRIGAVASVNNRNGSSASYHVVINNENVSLSADNGPSFRNTLSAGDRNTLALAFFFASLEQDPNLAQKIVVVDDPMTSLDEHRSLTTVQEVRRMLGRVSQMIVLSHSKPFLCALWTDANPAARMALRIARQGAGSDLVLWDVNQDCITEHDRRHALVSGYIEMSDPASERATAEALRPILEAFLRVAFPAYCPPSTMLGQFINTCRVRLAAGHPILPQVDIDELDALREYGNRFHHDTNAAWQTTAINDLELVGFCRRTLTFARR